MTPSTETVQQQSDDPLDREPAPGWIHQDAGDKVRGIVTGLGAYDGGYGAYPVVTIRLADGFRARVADKHGEWIEAGDEVAIHCAPTVLRNEMARLAPKVGDELGVRRGEMVDGARRPYPRFRVVKYGAEATLDWSRFGEPDDEPAGDVPGDAADLPVHEPLEDGGDQDGDNGVPF